MESALRSAALAESAGMRHDRIVLEGVRRAGPGGRLPHARRALRLSLHLGLTRAGLGAKGIIASTAGLSILLQEGIGDTIGCRSPPRPGAIRTEEVQVAQQVLQSLGLRSFTPR